MEIALRFHCATERTTPSVYGFSAESAKLVHLVRHGEGIHNVAAALRGAEAYHDQSLKDATLDDTGRLQASTLGQRIKEAQMQVDVILVSPLTRTLQTATEMFPDAVKMINKATLARQQTTALSTSSSSSSASSSSASSSIRSSTFESLVPATVPGYPSFIAIEMCREAHGGHPCDQRRSIAILRKEFPHVDFQYIDTNEDTWHNPQRRETVREVAIRGDKMLDIIRHRNERNILVVSHGVFLETLLNRCSLACVDEGLRARRFDNAEMRSIVIGGWGSIVYPPQLINPNKGALAQLMDNNSSNSSTDASVTNNSNGNTGINGITTTASTTTTTNK